MTEPKRDDPSNETVEIAAEYDHRFEAEHALSLLREQGIHAIIWSDDAGGVYPNIGFIERYQIRVLSGMLDRAREVLEEFGP